MRFRATIQLEGKTATGFRVPPEVVAALGRGKRPPVRVTIGPHTYRSTVAAYGDVFMLPLSAENRDRSGVAAGDEVDVELELDTEPRVLEVPADFDAALQADADARRTFDALSYCNRQWHVLSVEGAKTPETRQRRIARSVEVLRQGRAR
ncbi:MAG: YdeI/OmpD-associated family protein [Chloroflexota bacterium]